MKGLGQLDCLSDFSNMPEYAGLANIFPIVWLAESKETTSVRNHLLRVQNGSYWLAKKSGELESSARNIALASVFHDIGMNWIQWEGDGAHWYSADSLVRARMEPHTLMGGEFLKSLQQQICGLAGDIASAHHERWDGTGFPRVVKAEQIPLAARIVGVVHFFEENTHPDPKGMRMKHDNNDVIEMIKIAGGYYFDPKLSYLVANNATEFISVMQVIDRPVWNLEEAPIFT